MYHGKTLVVTLCMHRSGSSLTSHLMHRLGMSLGPFELLGPSETNKFGYFEATPIVELNKEVQRQVLGFVGDMPTSPAMLQSLCDCSGRWECDQAVLEPALQRAEELLRQLVDSAPISGFKDPRVPLLWPFWQQVFARFPGLRVVPLFLLRSPHEIAMSLFMRGEGRLAYRDALDVVAVHFQRMLAIRNACDSACGVIRFDTQAFPDDARRAAELVGLPWCDQLLAELYDPHSKHHEPAVVAHPAQDVFERLCGHSPRERTLKDLARLEADALVRERLLQKRLLEANRRAERIDSELVATYAEITRLNKVIGDQNYEAELIKSSRVWKARERLVGGLKIIGVKR